MTIKKCTQNLTMKDKYDLTRNPETERMANHKDEILSVDQYMIREEENGATGEPVTIVSIRSGDKCYATNSSVFVREFASLVEMAEEANDTIHHIKVIGGRSRNNRDFISCVYID